MKVWLDDARDPAQQGRVGWNWCRNFQEVIAMLLTGNVTFMSMDQDLSLDAAMGNPYPNEKGGYDVLIFMDEHQCWPTEGVIIHAARPCDMPRLHQAIARHYGQIEFPAGRLEHRLPSAPAEPYPSCRYHGKHGSRVVKSEDEDKALGEGWFRSPREAAAHLAKEAEPEDLLAEKAEAPKRYKQPRKW